MADKIILVDTSILIDLFRKTDKANSQLIKLVQQGYTYCISAITEYEIYSGATQAQYYFWNNFLQKVQVISFDQLVVKTAVQINNNLKKISKQVELANLFIGATALAYNLPFATLNRKHFERISEIKIID